LVFLLGLFNDAVPAQAPGPPHNGVPSQTE
jgi:hypothetical protein